MHLVSYVPFTRIDEITKYFVQNVQNVRPEKATVYVDVSREWHKPVARSLISDSIQLRFGTWMNGTSCLAQILLDFISTPADYMIVDSDIVIRPGWKNIDDFMSKRAYDFYAIHNENEYQSRYFERRSRLIETEPIRVMAFKIRDFYSLPISFGPKQAIRIGTKTLNKLDTRVIYRVQSSIERVHFRLRRRFADETALGTIFHYSGFREVPWFIHCDHYRRDAPEPRIAQRYVINAAIAATFGKGMMSLKYRFFYWYYLRYKSALLTNTIKLLLKRNIVRKWEQPSVN
jgi:hypothetical protein